MSTGNVYAIELNQILGDWTGVESLTSTFEDNYTNKPISITVTDASDRDGFLAFSSSSNFIYNADIFWAVHYVAYDKENNQIVFYKRYITPIGVLGNHELRYDIIEFNESAMILDYFSDESETEHHIRVTRDILSSENAIISQKINLLQNFPNPFNPVTTIQVSLDDPDLIQLDILDLTGRVVTNLVNGSIEPGKHFYTWNGTNHLGNPVSAGTYFYRLKSSNGIESKKMILLK